MARMGDRGHLSLPRSMVRRTRSMRQTSPVALPSLEAYFGSRTS